MKKRSRRSPEQLIADLNAKIEAIRARAEQKKAKKDPAGKHILAALRSIDRGLGEAKDAEMRRNLEEARATLATCISPDGAVPLTTTKARRRSAPEALADPAAVLRYLTSHPGSRCEDVANALEEESSAVSPVLKALKAEGRARTEGKARGTKYFAVKGAR